MDVSRELEDTNTYQNLIGILTWACELGRIDISTELIVLYQHLCNPREGHLVSVFRNFNYLNVNRESIPGKLGFDDFEQLPYIFVLSKVHQCRRRNGWIVALFV